MSDSINLWPFVFIIIAIAMVVGPIMMFKPSNRDRRLSDLRQAAALKGMRVRLASINEGESVTSVAVYSLSWGAPGISEPSEKTDKESSAEQKPHQQSKQQWVLLKGKLSHGIHFSDYWDWADAKHMAPENIHISLKQWIDSLDSSIVGVEMGKRHVGFYWTEKQLSIEAVEALLIQCRRDFAE